MTSGPTAVRVPARKSSAPAIVVSARRIAREYELAFPAGVFALHWLFVTVFAALATRFAYRQPTVRAVGWSLADLDGWRELVVQPMRNWDGFWYSLIAIDGYGFHPATTAFWPLYPWAMRAVSDFFGVSVEVAGLLLANLAFLLALIVLQKLARHEWGDGVARRAVVLLAFFPTAYYFSAVYSESFFLLFSLLAFERARAGRWWLAGLAAAAAALTRNVGILLVIPLAIMFLKQYGFRLDPRRWPRETFALALPGLGPAIYLGYLWIEFGDPLLTLDAQQGWARTQAMPWETFRMAWDQWGLAWLRWIIESTSWATLTSYPVRYSFSEYESLDIVATVLVVPLLIYCLRRLPIEYGAYTLVVFALPLFSPSLIHPLMSFPRFTLVLFPLFIGLAILTRRRWLYWGLLVPFCLLLAALTIQFSTWFWVA